MSFFGGGTDYPAWYNNYPGAVLATAINKYCYVTCRWLPPYFEHKYRISYSRVEEVLKVEEINHPGVREVITWLLWLSYLPMNEGLEIHHDGDLPARSGMGTSSSFTVGLLNGLYALVDRQSEQIDLAKTAILIEQQMMKENCGAQDQTIAAYGGFNRIDFSKGEISVRPVPTYRLQELQQHLMLFFTGFTRISSRVAEEQVNNTPLRERELSELYHLVGSGVQVLEDRTLKISNFGEMLHHAWMLKRSLSDKISTPYIDHLYEEGRKAGAIGGKILGAGGGGFILFFVEPDKQESVRKAIGLLETPFCFEPSGSKIIYRGGE